MPVSSCVTKTPKFFAPATQIAVSPKTHLSFSPNSRPKSPISISATSQKPQTHRRNRINCLFTGIVEEIGKIKRISTSDNDGGVSMRITGRTVLGGVNLGDSIAVNGTCLTVTQFDSDSGEFSVGLAPETLRRTSLGSLGPGSPVNLERAVLPAGRMGGHFVQGHVDGTGEIVAVEPEGDSLWVKVRAEREVLRYIVPKGFVAVDGASLTVVDVFEEESCFNFMLVAYTQQNVVIPMKGVGEKVNLEVDILGKYVERLLCGGFGGSLKSSS